MVLLYNTQKTNKTPNSLCIKEIAQRTEDSSLVGAEYSTGRLKRKKEKKKEKKKQSLF